MINCVRLVEFGRFNYYVVQTKRLRDSLKLHQVFDKLTENLTLKKIQPWNRIKLMSDLDYNDNATRKVFQMDENFVIKLTIEIISVKK